MNTYQVQVMANTGGVTLTHKHLQELSPPKILVSNSRGIVFGVEVDAVDREAAVERVEEYLRPIRWALAYVV